MTPRPPEQPPERGFDWHRESLLLPESVWSWLEHRAEATRRTRSEIATEMLRQAMETDPEGAK